MQGMGMVGTEYLSVQLGSTLTVEQATTPCGSVSPACEMRIQLSSVQLEDGTSPLSPRQLPAVRPGQQEIAQGISPLFSCCSGPGGGGEGGRRMSSFID